MRRIVALISAALIGIALIGVTTACGAPARSAAAHPAGGTSVPQLTRDQAEQVFSGFVPELDSMQLSYGAAQIASLTTGLLARVQQFQARIAGTQTDFTEGPIGTLSGQQVYVPVQSGYPRWFLASGTASSTRSAALFVMVQASRGAPWKAAIEMAHVLGSPLTAALGSIALDSGGYATALPANDPLLTVSPSSLPALYARQQDSRPGPVVFAAGTNTTAFLAQDRSVEARSPAYGWRVTDIQRPSSLPVYALTAKNGGAVVIFVTYDQFSWTALSAAAQLPRSGTKASGQLYEPAPDYASAAGVTAVRAGLRISLQSFCQCIADVPAANGGLMNLADYSGGILGVTRN